MMNDGEIMLRVVLQIRCCFRALRRGVGARRRELELLSRDLLNVAPMDGTVDCEGFERLVQLAQGRGQAPPALPQP